MKEKEFIEKMEGLVIPISVYYGIGDDGNVQLDEDSMQEEWEEKFKEVQEILKDKDELTEIVKEKIIKINKEKKNE